MSMAPVYQPRVQVLLYKNVGRTTAGDGIPLSQRFRGAKRIIDLAPWLSDSSGVRTSKSVREPAGGFTITLADRIHQKDLDSIYGLVEPMDCIEIRMAHDPQYQPTLGEKLPIIMRGFISEVSRAEGMSGNGKPQRQVIITGQDYGKLWQIFQIFFEKNFPVGATLISNWKIFLKFGMAFENQSCRSFMKEAVDKILNPFIREMKKSDEKKLKEGEDDDVIASPLQEIKIRDEDITAAPGSVAPTGVNTYQNGTLYGMLHMFGDVGPWNELFLEDREEGVFLVYRPNPFYAVNGEYLPRDRFGNKEAVEPDKTDLFSWEIQSINVSRSDGNVANYFWVDAPRSQMTNGSTAKLLAVDGAPETFLVNHRNASQNIYGLRKMFEVTNQGDPLDPHHGNGTDKETRARQYSLTAGWVNKRRVEIVEQNKDNVVFESGSLRILGRDDIRAGMYLELLRGSIKYQFYIVQVNHEFIPYQGFFTTLTVERGTGFIVRAQRGIGKQSPYFAELATDA
jgi:hypothetical protein